MDKNEIELESISFDLEGHPRPQGNNNVHKRTIVAQNEEDFHTAKQEKENGAEEFRKMQEAKVAAEERRKRLLKRRRRQRQQDIDDWFAGDYSCCLCLPIELGVQVIAVFTALNSLLLLWQINSVTDDGSSKGERAGPMFYNISYLCLSPFLYAIFQFFKQWRKDSEYNREQLITANMASFASIIALYTWMFVFFVSIEDSDFQTKNTILLIVLIFASPQIMLYAYFDGVLKRFAQQIEED